jgi:hypothetical protein
MGTRQQRLVVSHSLGPSSSFLLLAAGLEQATNLPSGSKISSKQAPMDYLALQVVHYALTTPYCASTDITVS